MNKTQQQQTEREAKIARAMATTEMVIADQVRHRRMTSDDVRAYAAAVAELFGRIADEAEDAGE